MDVLTDILDTLRFKGSLYFRAELSSPWCIRVPAQKTAARFHIAQRGQCWFTIDGSDEKVAVAKGDLIIVPHGAGHTICDDLGSKERDLAGVLKEINYSGTGPMKFGGGGPGVSLVCGEFGFSDDVIHPLLSKLPPFLHVPAGEGITKSWMESALRFIALEVEGEKQGSKAIIDRLSEIIFIQVARTIAAQDDQIIPFMAALGDVQISKALGQIHARPEANLSVEELGSFVGLSRSAFSNRFTGLVGLSPHKYSSLIRLQKAAKLLETSDDSILSVAVSVGYKSEAAFSSAFKSQYGLRPGEYRKSRKE